MQRSVRSHRIVRAVLAIGLTIAVAGCATPGASPEPSTAAPTLPPAVAVTLAPTPAFTPAVSPSPVASPIAASSGNAGTLATSTVPATSGPAGSIQVEMFGPPPQFRPKALTGTGGATVTFFLVNDSPAREEHGGHALAIGRKVGEPLAVSAEIKGGGRAVFTVQGLTAGTYAIWCPLYGHADLGQVGTLTLD